MHLRPWAFIALLVSLLAAGPLSADEVALRISLHQPAEGLLGQNLQEFKKMVEAETKGAVKVSIYDKASFYLDYQVPEGVSSGAIEMGVAPLAAYTDEIPPAGLFMQPFLFNFDAIVRAASARGSEIRKLIDAEIEKKAGVKVLWWQPYGPNVVFGKGSMADPKALAGRNVRVFDEISAKFISDCGGTPHIISDGKQAEAFDMNIVDSSVASVATVNDDELWRKIGTIYENWPFPEPVPGHRQRRHLQVSYPEGPGAAPRGGQQGRGQRLGKIPGFRGQDLRVRRFQRHKGARAVSRRHDCLARLQLLDSGILYGPGRRPRFSALRSLWQATHRSVLQ